MARIFIDGFESGDFRHWDFTTGVDSGSDLPSTSFISSAGPLGLSGNRCYQSNHNNQYIFKFIDPELSEAYLAFKIRRMEVGQLGGVMAYLSSGGTTLFSLVVTADNKIGAIVGSGSTPTVTSTATLSINTVYLIELRFKLDDSAGIIQVKIDGTLDIDYSGDTKPGSDTTFGRLKFGNTATAEPCQYIDDVILDDSDWIGNTKITMITSSGVGNSVQWEIPDQCGDISVDICTGGSAIDGGTFDGNVARAFDKDVDGSNYTASDATGASIKDTSWIGYDFGSGVTKEIVAFGMMQSLWGPTLNSVYLRYSDDGSTWTTLETFSGMAESVTSWAYRKISVPSGGAHRYWSLMAASGLTGSYTWRIAELIFYENPDANWKAVDHSDKAYTRKTTYKDRITIGALRSNTNGEIDTYAFSNLTGDIGLVRCVQLSALVGKKGASSVDNLKLIARPSSTDRKSDSIPVSYEFALVTKLWELSPETADYWTESEINGCEFGFEAVT